MCVCGGGIIFILADGSAESFLNGDDGTEDGRTHEYFEAAAYGAVDRSRGKGDIVFVGARVGA